MKKLMYVAVFAIALGFTACGSDDDGGGDSFECAGITFTRGANGNAFVDGDDTGQDYDEAAAAAASGLCDIQIGF